MRLSNVQNVFLKPNYHINYHSSSNFKKCPPSFKSAFIDPGIDNNFGFPLSTHLDRAALKKMSVDNRYKYLLKSKFRHDLSKTEFIILSQYQNLSANYEIFDAPDEDYKDEDSDLYDEEYNEERIAQKKVDEYVEKCMQSGNIMFDDDDISAYIKYKNSVDELAFNIEDGIRYVYFLKGYALKNHCFSELESKYFADEKYRYNEVEGFLTYLLNHKKALRYYREILDTKLISNMRIDKSQINGNFIINFFETNYDKNFDNYQVINYTIDDKSNLNISRCDEAEKNSKFFFRSENKYDSFYIRKKINRDYSPTEATLEIETTRNSIPSKIIKTNYSKKDSRFLEQKAYNFSDFDESVDVVKLVDKSDDIKNVKPSNIAHVEVDKKGNVTYKAKFRTNDCTSKIYYKESKNQKGYKIYNYDYLIKDNDDNVILDLKRTHQQLDENTSQTIIDGETFYTTFNDDGTISISKEKNSKNENSFRVLPDRQTVKNCLMTIGYARYDRAKDFFLQIPADILAKYSLCNPTIEFIKNDCDSCADITIRKIYTTLNPSLLIHELAHLFDFDEDDNIHISNNEELKKIYSKELKKFYSNKPFLYTHFLAEYIGSYGSNNYEARQVCDYDELTSSGLAEMLADSLAMSVLPYSNCPVTEFRCLIIKKYFPKTLAKSLELIDKRALELIENQNR